MVAARPTDPLGQEQEIAESSQRLARGIVVNMIDDRVSNIINAGVCQLIKHLTGDCWEQ